MEREFLKAANNDLTSKSVHGSKDVEDTKIQINNEILCVGLLCVDIVSVVPKFIAEDSDQRCTKQTWERGGNASNNASVLAQLGAPVEFLGVIAQDHLLSFFQTDMTAYGINHTHCQILPGYQAPTSIVISSEETGSRTIIHNNGGLPEITFDYFQHTVKLENYKWIHFEGRNMDQIEKILQFVQDFNAQNNRDRDCENGSQLSQSQSQLNKNENATQLSLHSPKLNFQSKKVPVSIEVEKIKWKLENLLKYADVAFVGKEFAEFHGAKDYIEAALNASKFCQPGTLVICPWGEKGASWCIVPDPANNNDGSIEVKTVDAYPPPKILDSLGAGDTFDASVIFALTNGLDIDSSVRFGCKVAGSKLGTFGFKEINRIAQDMDEFKKLKC